MHRRRRSAFFIWFLFFLVLVALPSSMIPTLIVTTQNRGTPLLTFNQTIDFLLGIDMMLGVGDALRVQTTVINEGDAVATAVELVVLDFPMTVCEPDSVDNVIGNINPGDMFLCTSIRTITQMDMLAGFMGPFNFTIGSMTEPIVVALDVQTVSSLSIMFNETLDLGPEEMLSEGDNLTIGVKIFNDGNQTLLNVTGSEASQDQLAPGEYFYFEKVFPITLDDIVRGFVDIQETVIAIGISDLQILNVTQTFRANTTQTTVAEISVAQTGMVVETTDGCSYAGDTAMVEIIVSNSGTETLTAVSVTNNRIGTLVCEPLNVDNMIGVLEPMDTYTCRGNYLTVLSDYQSPANGALISDTTVTATRFTTQSAFLDTRSLSFPLVIGQNVRIYNSPHRGTSSTGRGSVLWDTSRFYNNVPLNWNNRVFVTPASGTYRLRSRVGALAGSGFIQVRINNVPTPYTIGGGNDFGWEGTLNMGDQVFLYDDTTFTGLLDRPGFSYFCLYDV